jgi:hypothetical protein
MANGGLDGVELTKQMFEEIRHIRRRLDEHIDDESKTLADIHGKLSGHAARLGAISGGIAVVTAAVVSWLLSR